MVTPGAKRQAVDHLRKAHGVSQRRACAAMQVDRSTVRYQSKRPDDSELREEIKLVAKERRRFGYRRIQVMLERKGIYMNITRQVIGTITERAQKAASIIY